MSTKDLRALINELRDLANDGDAALFDDNQATDWLNEGANHFCLETQILNFPVKIPIVAGQNEYPLDIEEGDVMSVTFNQGGVSTPIDEIDVDEVNLGARTTASRPVGFYVRQNSAYLMGKDESAGTDLFTFVGPEYRYVLGVWPIPSEGELTVWLAIEHPVMQDPADRCLIPFRFQFAPIAWAVYKAKLKEQAHAEADIYAKTFDALTDKGKERQIFKGVSKQRTRMRRRESIDETEVFNRRWFD